MSDEPSVFRGIRDAEEDAPQASPGVVPERVESTDWDPEPGLGDSQGDGREEKMSGRLFARGVRGDHTLAMQLFGLVMNGGILLVVLALVGALWYGGRWAWSAVEEFEWSSGVESCEPLQGTMPLGSLPALVAEGRPSERLAAKLRRAPQAEIGGEEAKVVRVHGAKLIVVRDRAAPGGVAFATVVYDEPIALCPALAGAGLLARPMEISVGEDGSVSHPDAPVRIRVSPASGEVEQMVVLPAR